MDSHHFWGQLITHGEYYESVKQMHEMMEDLDSKIQGLPLVTQRSQTRAVTVFEGELTRVWIMSMTEATSQVFYIDYGNVETVSTSHLFVAPERCWDVRPVATPFYFTGSGLNLKEFVNMRITATRVPSLSYSDELRYVVTIDTISKSSW
jgi:hypothetical protein